MNNKTTISIILAAGKGTRMKSDVIKVLHQVAGKPIISHVIDAVKTVSDSLYMVIGHQSNTMKQAISDSDITFVQQKEQLGTGHAVQQVIPLLTQTTDSNTIILPGDCPLISPETLKDLLAMHTSNKSAATILTAHMTPPTGYGRLLRDSENSVIGIKEQKDCSKKEAEITEINSGIYVFNTSHLITFIKQLSTDNAQGEYYLTDIIHHLVEQNHHISALCIPSSDEIIGINSRQDLAKSNKAIFKKNALYHMENGVTIVDPATTCIESSVSIGQDTIIHPFTSIYGNSKIGKHCVIQPHTHANNIILKDEQSYP